MKPNKITDNIFKKLIKNNFSREDIKTYLDLQSEFASFENYIYYLLVLAGKNFDDINVKMSQSLTTYLQYLATTEHLQAPLLDNLQRSDILSDREIFLLNVKQYTNDSGFSYDLDNNLFICLDNTVHFNYTDIINVRLPTKDKSYLRSKLARKIIQVKFNKICIFKKHMNKNIFLGFYKFHDIAKIYDRLLPYDSVLLISEKNTNLSLFDEYANILERNRIEALSNFKQVCKDLIIGLKDDSYYLLEIITHATDHYLLIKQLLQHCLSTNNQKLLTAITAQFPDLCQTKLSTLNLIPNYSIVNPYYLTILANTYDILYGTQINADYLHNIFICIPQQKLNNNKNGQIQIRFVKSYNKHFFDLEINKKIFETANSATIINLWTKLDDQRYLFKGFFKVSKITIGNDLQNNLTPIFNLRPINGVEKLMHLDYLLVNETSNKYKNNFIDMQAKLEQFKKWLTKTEVIEPVVINRQNDVLNSHLYKYNWILNKCLNSLDTPDYDKYLHAYADFDRVLFNNILKCLSYNFEYLLTNTIMQPWTIAYEMTKRNWASKDLFDIAYIDFYEPKSDKYMKCLKILAK